MDGNVIFNKDEEVPSDGQNATGPTGMQPVTVIPPSSETLPEQTSQSSDLQTTASPTDTAGPIDVPPSDIPPSEETPRGFLGGGLLKKIIIGVVVLILIIFIVILFMPKGASNKKVKLVWWGLWEEKQVMEPLISDFQRKNPNITIEYVLQDPKQYREKLQARIKNGTGPDIFRFHNTWTPMISTSLLPMSSAVISSDEFKKSFYPVMQKDLIINGGIYGIPLGADTLSLFVNTEIFEKAGVEVPQNWDDFGKAARKLTVKDDEDKIKTAGAAIGAYGNITHAPDVISLLFIQQGIDMKKFPSAKKKDKIDSLNFYTSFVEGEETIWDTTLEESILFFAQGNLAMYFGYSWDIFRIQTLNKDLPFEVYPVPQLVGRQSALASYWAEGVSSKTKNPKEAFIFMKYLSQKDTAQKFYASVTKTRAFGEPYARRDLADSLKNNKMVYPFVSQLGNASSSVFASDTYDGEGGLNFSSNNYLGNAVNSIVEDGTSSQTAVNTLDLGVNQVFKKYGIR